MKYVQYFLKFFVYIALPVGVLEILNMAFWLMRQPSSLLVYTGFFLAWIPVVFTFLYIKIIITKAISYFSKPKQNNESNL
ncbi:MAG: hypothetical protein EBR30_02555 [Cytophagia bacterium]|nr:hypothetical protein [Cytophagia bacterium]NBW33916.1 hypothetical protein [Cytophagia bacterium]